LRPDDVVRLRPGDRVPTDGQVCDGDSAVDESMLTGESTPVDKKPGAPLYAGTVNLNGRLLMRVTATGESTALAHIIEAVQRAQNSRANIQRLGDQVSSVFVPVVVVIAILTAAWWGLMPAHAQAVATWLGSYLWTPHIPAAPLAAAFIGAAAVLIIACPCAMGLATPAAIMAASNAAARRGILIRDGVALERAGKVTSILFDKTGTLTAGRPVVVAATSFAGFPVNAIAAALARHSTHPLSQAVAKLSDQAFEFASWQEIGGSGVQGTLRAPSDEPLRGTLRLGSLAWLRGLGVNDAGHEPFWSEWSAKGATVLGLAADQTLLGLLAVQDTLKPHVSAVVKDLRDRGLKVFLVTGDNRPTAESIAAEVGIEAGNVFAEVRPEQKADRVKQLQAAGERVAFVGDGINDAPALEQADLGIAVSRASDVAREAADIILLNSDVEAVTGSLALARATLRTIKQNLFWAFFYNAVGIPLAALGFMSPILCAAAMGLSDLVVIGNALRLRHGGS
jgi:Cu+-exporting ATPase